MSESGDEIRGVSWKLAGDMFGGGANLMGLAVLFGWAWAAQWAFVLILAGVFVVGLMNAGASAVDKASDAADWVKGRIGLKKETDASE